MDAPTISISNDNMENILRFIYTHESLLKQYGAIKITPPIEFKDLSKVKPIQSISSSSIQQVSQLNQNHFIYSINTVTVNNENTKRQLPSLNEGSFWQLLSHSRGRQQISRVSILSNTSFFLQQRHQSGFDIHQLPRQSLLKCCTGTLLDKFVPKVIRTHGPGGISPLGSSRQRLFTFNYHHEGGVRYWYIIPASERQALEYIFQKKNISVCLDHGHILINPILLDKWRIRYYCLVQHPNEIVILSAGALSQSFTQDAGWSESIEFALPSWLNDGHATAEILCACILNINPLPELIDVHRFSDALIQQYICDDLKIIVDNSSSTNIDGQKPKIYQTSMSSNVSSISINQLSKQKVESCLNINSLFEDDDINYHKRQKVSGIPMEHDRLEALTVNKYYPTQHPYRTSTTSNDDSQSQNISSIQNSNTIVMKSSNEEHRHSSFQQKLDGRGMPSNVVTAVVSQTKEQSDDQKQILNYSSFHDNNTRMKNDRNQNVTDNEQFNTNQNQNKTLFVSSMRHEVTTADIKHHFGSCVKVTLKRHSLAPSLKYAFVLHRSHVSAECNRTKPINPRIFGENCFVEFARNNIHQCNEDEHFHRWTIVVKHIPDNVRKDDLHKLFVDCELMQYIPACMKSDVATRVIPSTKNKLLLGHAFLYYSDADKAGDVVKNADTFKINNQSLNIAFCKSLRSRSQQR